MPVSTFFSVMNALGTTALEESVTVPSTALENWADSGRRSQEASDYNEREEAT